MTTSATRALALIAVVAAAGYVVGLGRDWAGFRLVTKPVPVLCLLALVLSQAARSRYARLIAAGLALSALGDVLLEFPGLFVAGLGAFLCAHVSYTAAFLTGSNPLRPLRALPILAWLGVVYTRLAPGLGDMRVPVMLYVLAIGIMMWRAAARVGHDGPPQRAELSALAGAVLFGLSDTLIGLDRFHAPIAGVRYPIGLLYWAGQTGIALSAPWPRSAPIRP